MITEFSKQLNSFLEHLDKKEQSYMHLRSMRNFIMHYNRITTPHIAKVDDHMSAYFTFIANERALSWEQSNKLYWSHVLPLGVIYAADANFKMRKIIGYSVFLGLIGDFLLYLTPVSVVYYHVPLVTFILVCRWMYTRFLYERKNCVYGPRY